MPRRRFPRSFAVLLGAGAVLAIRPGAARAQEDTTRVEEPEVPAIVDSLQAAIDTIQEAHPQDSPEETGFVFAAPDGLGSFRLRASIRLNGAWDFSGLRSTDVFDTYQIPVGSTVQTDNSRFFMQATQTRFGFDLNRDTGGGIVFGRIETDFRGAGNSLRLRHAYGEYRRFLAGQTWSTFTDVTALPVTVDFEGPPSSNSVRTPQIRYTVSPAESWSAALAIEAPRVDATQADSTAEAVFDRFQGFGDVAARLRRNTGWGHVTVSTILRSITLQDFAGESRLVPGVGVQLSGRIDLDGEDEILFQAIGGRAISRFVGSLGGKGLDVIQEAETGQWRAVTSYGGYVTYAHRWLVLAPGLISNLTVGGIGVVNEEFQPDDAFHYSFYLSANGFWRVTAGSRVGGELSWGRRVNRDGASGDAFRFSFAAYFDF